MMICLMKLLNLLLKDINMPKVIKIKKLLGTLSSGNRVFVEAVRIDSGIAGQKIYIQAALHGWEIAGITVCWQLIKYFSKNLQKGIMTIVPIANPWGVDAKIGNKQVGYVNLNGDEAANWNEIFVKNHKWQEKEKILGMSREMILAKTLQELAVGHDIAIDLHTAWNCIDHVYYFSHQKEMVKWFGISDCIEWPYGFTGAFDESFLYPYEDKTRFAYTVEFNENCEPNTQKIINFLTKQKTIRKFNFWKEKDLKFIYSPGGGIMHYLVKPGEVMKKSQQIGKVVSKNKQWLIKAPWPAKICYLGTNYAVDTGQRICALLINPKMG